MILPFKFEEDLPSREKRNELGNKCIIHPFSSIILIQEMIQIKKKKINSATSQQKATTLIYNLPIIFIVHNLHLNWIKNQSHGSINLNTLRFNYIILILYKELFVYLLYVQ